MTSEETINSCKSKMKKAFDVFNNDLGSLRTGRANIAMQEIITWFMRKRQYTRLDNIIIQIDTALNGSSKSHPEHVKREYPGKLAPESNLSRKEKKHVSGLMRVNHAGEV